jgi:uncharacterized protein YaiI (UPF0178 family)
MKLLIDADGCPVTRPALHIARKYRIPCLIVCDTAHEFRDTDAAVLTVSKGADSADFALVNRIDPGDLVITQDYGLAAMCLARSAAVLHPNGFEYTAESIDALLAARHNARKIRQGGGRLKGPSKRSAAQDAAFCALLEEILSRIG